MRKFKITSNPITQSDYQRVSEEYNNFVVKEFVSNLVVIGNSTEWSEYILKKLQKRLDNSLKQMSNDLKKNNQRYSEYQIEQHLHIENITFELMNILKEIEIEDLESYKIEEINRTTVFERFDDIIYLTGIKRKGSQYINNSTIKLNNDDSLEISYGLRNYLTMTSHDVEEFAELIDDYVLMLKNGLIALMEIIKEFSFSKNPTNDFLKKRNFTFEEVVKSKKSDTSYIKKWKHRYDSIEATVRFGVIHIPVLFSYSKYLNYDNDIFKIEKKIDDYSKVQKAIQKANKYISVDNSIIEKLEEKLEELHYLFDDIEYKKQSFKNNINQ